MQKMPLIAVIIAFVCVIALYQLPKAVVKNKPKDNKKTETTTQNPKENAKNTTQESNQHGNSLAPEQLAKKNNLLKKLKEAKNDTEKMSLWDSLAQFHKKIMQLDSTAYYFAQISDLNPQKNRQTAGAYYEAFRYALSVNADKAKKMGEEARNRYTKIITENPKDYEAMANQAMTYTITENPMQGIKILQKILQEDEKNALAMLNLGLLAIQSNQFDKAINRFEKLLSIYPNYHEAQLYLANAYVNGNKKQKAIEILEKLQKLEGDSLSPYRESAKDYLKTLK